MKHNANINAVSNGLLLGLVTLIIVVANIL